MAIDFDEIHRIGSVEAKKWSSLVPRPSKIPIPDKLS